MKYVAPEFQKTAFHCPRCQVYANQLWPEVLERRNVQALGERGLSRIPSLSVSLCGYCGKYSVWYDGILVAPGASTAPPAHAEMPDDIKADYDEARDVFSKSPRSSAALLRLAVEKLCKSLGKPGNSLNENIGALMEAGLPQKIQQAFDIVRVTGSEQVHPGKLDVRDNPDIALALFELVNLIVQDRIAEPKQIAEMYQKLPKTKLEQIEQRDAPKPHH